MKFIFYSTLNNNRHNGSSSLEYNIKKDIGVRSWISRKGVLEGEIIFSIHFTGQITIITYLAKVISLGVSEYRWRIKSGAEKMYANLEVLSGRESLAPALNPSLLLSPLHCTSSYLTFPCIQSPPEMQHKYFIYSPFTSILQTFFLHTFTNTTWDNAKFILRIFHNDLQPKKVPFIVVREVLINYFTHHFQHILKSYHLETRKERNF